MKNKSVRYMTSAALIAALYTALTLVLAPLSFGPVQIRVSEVLTVLPAVYPPAILGLTLGCFLSNLIGFLMGANALGLIDCAVGTVATLIAALLCYLVGKKFKGFLRGFLAALCPIVLNGLFVGVEIAVLIIGDTSIGAVALSCIYVALGEIIPCTVGAIVFLKGEKSIFKDLFSKKS